MTGPCVLACDLGTSGCKVSLVAVDGQIVATHTRGYPLSMPGPDQAEQDPEQWWQALVEGCRGVMERAGAAPHDVAGITFSGQMMGCVCTDGAGRALRPAIIWADQRSRQEAAEIGRHVPPDDFYRITGNRLHPTYPIAKFRWVKVHEPEVYRATRYFLQAKDWIVARLTGELVTDWSDASTTAALDLAARRWSQPILDAAGVDVARLPPIVPGATVAGRVGAAAARALGVAEGTPVFPGAGDGPCATLGAGVSQEGEAYIYLGSSSWVSLATRRPLFDPGQRTFNVLSADPEVVLGYGTMQTGGAALQWLADAVGAAETGLAATAGLNRYELLDQAAARSTPTADGLLFLPYLMGERSPYYNADARGAFLGLTLRHHRGDLVRAVLEGVAYNLRIIRDAFLEQGVAIHSLRAIGGGARSPLWTQLLADIFDQAIDIPAVREEANTLGAALVALTGLGVFPDLQAAAHAVQCVERREPVADPATKARYERHYRRFRRAYQVLEPFFPDLREPPAGAP